MGFFGRVARVGQTPYPAYEVVAGARLGHGTSRLAESVGTIAAHDVPAFVVDVVGRYLAQADAGAFSEYFANQGKQHLVELCTKYRNVPAFEDDKNYYFDWGATEMFSLAGRGIAECSAGLFDLIEVDLKRLKELRQERDATPSRDPSDQAIYEMVLLSARMLLITRGEEAASEAQVFELFRRHFLDAGLVPAKYGPLLDAARAYDVAGLRRRVGEAYALAEVMADLYARMDNALRFPGEAVAKPKAATSVVSDSAAVETRDLRGVLCPMNFVKTKLALAALSVGQRLRVLLDDGPAIHNVPRSVTEEGHRIVEQIKHDDHWAVLIEKR